METIEELEMKVISLRSHISAMKKYADMNEEIFLHREVDILKAEDKLRALELRLLKVKKEEPPQ
mgnify:CR=1 FL=1